MEQNSQCFSVQKTNKQTNKLDKSLTYEFAKSASS